MRNFITTTTVYRQYTNEHSFMEYLGSGLEISLMVAIDFTVSNGNPTSPKSLHYNNPHGEPNEYVKAISSVGDILAHYDRNQRFPVYGFGGKPRGAPATSHCFPINGNWSNPECNGVGGVLAAYWQALQTTELSAPTTFSDVIDYSAKIVRAAQGMKYFVLLLLTDGAITQGSGTTYVQDTIKAIITASNLPLSIVIVGVGNEDFSQMVVLDADEEPLRLGRMKAKRDVVQFVPFRDFKMRHPSFLAAHVLAEIPNQVLTYMALRGITPQTPIPAGQSLVTITTTTSTPAPSPPNRKNKVVRKHKNSGGYSDNNAYSSGGYPSGGYNSSTTVTTSTYSTTSSHSPSSSSNAVWSWRGDAQDWIPYDRSLNDRIEMALMSGDAQCRVDHQRFVDLTGKPKFYQRRYDDPSRHRDVKREGGGFSSGGGYSSGGGFSSGGRYQTQLNVLRAKGFYDDNRNQAVLSHRLVNGNVAQAENYLRRLDDLAAMGFTDVNKNINALSANNNDVARAVNQLVG
eukprot:TRINITY_DN22311_c0_g1_i1.p1 TRINITY_DN22311_c0_g1~~TRINITY_DN22311_c0_g1_i1.p1  ORF type:complete len:514 (-),score=73.49 TRINITY_DN22311_c0_g1_i1:61-1602(-)